MPSIEHFKSAVANTTGFLTGNRYKVTLSKLNSGNLSLFCNKVDLPSIDYTQVDLDIGGKLVHVPSKYALGDIQLTFYNTGPELLAIYNFCNANVYMPNHAIGYYDDIAMDIQVVEYNTADTVILTRKFRSCILKSVSTISLAYAESTEVQQFTISFSCGSYLMN